MVIEARTQVATHCESRQSSANRVRKCEFEGESGRLGRCHGKFEA